MAVITASKLHRASGSITTAGGSDIIDFSRMTRLVTIMVKPSAGNTMTVKYTLDADASPVLWAEWSLGSVTDAQISDQVFDGGFHQIEISGDGDYSYSWD